MTKANKSPQYITLVSVIVFSLALMLYAFPVHAQDLSYCSQGDYGYNARISQTSFLSGQNIDFCLRDDTRDPMFSNPSWDVLDNQNNIVFTSTAGSPGTTAFPIYYGEWNQRDNNGNLVPSGNYSLVFNSTPNNASISFTISNNNNSDKDAYAILNNYKGLPGESITVSGFRFLPNDNIKVKFLNTEFNLTTDQIGNFTNSQLVVPNTHNMPQNTQITFTSLSRGKTVSANYYIDTYYANGGPSQYYILPGQSIGFYGKGFAPNETVILNVPNGLRSLSFQADSNGNFSSNNSLMFPYTFSGQKLAFSLSGNTSGAIVNFNIEIGKYYPQIEPSSYYVGKNTDMSVSGKNFAPNEPVDLYINGTKIESGNADGSGNINLNFITPNSGNQFDVRVYGDWSMGDLTRTITLAQ